MITVQRGATLVELVMTIVIISVAIAGVVGAFALISGRSADALNETRAVELAQLYLDEVMSKKYDDQTPPGGVDGNGNPYTGADRCGVSDEGQSRTEYDDVDDYDSINGPPTSKVDNTALSGYSGYTVAIDVVCAGADLSVSNNDVKRIDMTISSPGGGSFIFSAYKANF